MRGAATWLVLTAIGVIVIAGVVDAVRQPSSHAAAGANESTTERLTTTASSVQATTEPVATTEGVAATQAVATATPGTQSDSPPEPLPSCATRQLKLSFTIADGLAALELRRVAGKPCRHGRSPIGFTIRDQSGDGIAVFGESTRATQPADFSDGFEQLIEIPQMSCDPEGSFLVIATVDPYMVRRTLPGAELPCNHG
jgi:hypothetical protein